MWYARRPSAGHPSTYVPVDSSLRKPWMFYYGARPGPPRAVVVLFGNDVSFWEPHQDLAWRLAGDGNAVIGVDLRRFLATLPSDEPQRDSAFGVAISTLIARARHELHADDLPLVVGGHSFGAELAFWVAWHRPPPHLAGVLALNTRGSGHLYITPADWMNEEASGPWSFSTIDAARLIDPSVRVALVRGAKDRFQIHDSALVAAGGPRLRRYVIPMAAHSLSTMLVAGPVISRAVRFLTDTARVSNR
ncbi:MAG: hypothetical protein JWM41_2230 [Gemmatimonadetes bacterium]|nr:hypothetical protein [Gemmatimonadota bacterium]